MRRRGTALRVMVGMPWPQHVAFLDDPGLTRQIRRDALATVQRLASHPAVLMFAVGNEIPPAIVRWHGQRHIERFLRELCHDIKAAAPDSLLTYVNFPPTEYLELDCFDVCAVQRLPASRTRPARLSRAAAAHRGRPSRCCSRKPAPTACVKGWTGRRGITAMHVRAAFAEGACGAVAFSWTDEWWRGGHTVDDWAFGLVDAERRPKPALAAVESAFADAPFAADERSRWPKVSVVVCAYNAADTIDDCLTSLAALTYPRNGGHRRQRRLGAIATRDHRATVRWRARHRHAERRAQRRAQRRPRGGDAARSSPTPTRTSGSIPTGSTYLVQPLLTHECRRRRRAERRAARRPLGGAMRRARARRPDPRAARRPHRRARPGLQHGVPARRAAGDRRLQSRVVLRAGDDVDVCWRLQAKGLRIGFAPSALVWHHHRATIERVLAPAGRATAKREAWLDAHHPEKFVARADAVARAHLQPAAVRALASRQRASTPASGARRRFRRSTARDPCRWQLAPAFGRHG